MAERRRLVLLDTNVLVYGVLGQVHPGQEHNLERARALMTWIDQRRDHICTAALCVAEICMGIPQPAMLTTVQAIIGRGIRVVPFDPPAALAMAQLFQRLRPEWDRAKGIEGLRHRMRHDMQVIACGKAARVDVIYSMNSDFLSMASGFQLAQSVPDEALMKQQTIEGVQPENDDSA